MFPSFDEHLHFLNKYVLQLVDAYNDGKINSWTELDKRVKLFFSKERMEQMDKLVPGWKKMASYSDGLTQTHIACVFLGVFMLPEYQALTPEEQQISKWIVLFHDLDKFHIKGKKDTMHGFRSGILAAHTLPKLGFPVTEKYHDVLDQWSELTLNAYVENTGETTPIPDNQKLPEILKGVDQLFVENSPASLITKTVLLHFSISVDPNYPTPAPFTDIEIKRFVTPEVLPLLRVMMMGDNEGWSLFKPEIRKKQYKDTQEAFEKMQGLIADNNLA